MIGFERKTLLTSSKGALEEFEVDKVSSQIRNTIRELNPKRTGLAVNEKLFDRSGAYYNNEDWYLTEGKQLHIPTGKEISANAGKIIKENIKPDFKNKEGILGIVTDVYNLLSNWFLEEDVKDLQEAKKQEKKAKESITVKTETK